MCRLHRDQVTVLQWPFCWWREAAQGSESPFWMGKKQENSQSDGRRKGVTEGLGVMGVWSPWSCLCSLQHVFCWEMPELSPEAVAQQQKLA